MNIDNYIAEHYKGFKVAERCETILVLQNGHQQVCFEWDAFAKEWQCSHRYSYGPIYVNRAALEAAAGLMELLEASYNG